MVDVGGKQVTKRAAIARGFLRMRPETLARIVAGIMAAKRTAELIPMCHPLPVEVATVSFAVVEPGRLRIDAQVKVNGKTGVEMEALAAVSVAALTVYDMCKAIDRGMVIEEICVVEKRGGRSGVYRRPEQD